MSYEKQAWSKYDALKSEEENIENGAVVTDSRMNHMENGISDSSSTVENHIANKLNPHSVTKTQVGLGNVQNFGLATEDEAKQGASNAKYMTPSLTQAVLSANINSIAYANSADGTDDFTTISPNLNLLDGTKDFSGTWTNSGFWTNDGTYKGLTVKSYQGSWNGMFEKYIVPQDGLYTWSSFVKSESDTSNIFRVLFINNNEFPIVGLGHKFDWLRDSVTVSLKKGDEVIFNYGNSENNGGKLSVAGYKLEQGSIATPYMQSSSEVTADDWPKFVGFSNKVKTNKSASDYTWFPDLTNKVEDHVNNKSNPHGVTASQVGSYTKSEVATLISEAIKQSKLDANPIGTILTTISDTNPSSYIGGVWERYGKGRTLVSVDEEDSVSLMKAAGNNGGSTNPLSSHAHDFNGRTSGESIVAGSTNNPDIKFQGASSGNGLKSAIHSHAFSGTTTTTGDNTDHNNWQPFVTVYFWRRTA